MDSKEFSQLDPTSNTKWKLTLESNLNPLLPPSDKFGECRLKLLEMIATHRLLGVL